MQLIYFVCQRCLKKQTEAPKPSNWPPPPPRRPTAYSLLVSSRTCEGLLRPGDERNEPRLRGVIYWRCSARLDKPEPISLAAPRMLVHEGILRGESLAAVTRYRGPGGPRRDASSVKIRRPAFIGISKTREAGGGSVGPDGRGPRDRRFRGPNLNEIEDRSGRPLISERVTGAEGMHGRAERASRVSIPEYTLEGTDRKRSAHKSNLDPAFSAERATGREGRRAPHLIHQRGINRKTGQKQNEPPPRTSFSSSSFSLPPPLASRSARLLSLPASSGRSVSFVALAVIPPHDAPMHPGTLFSVSDSSVENEPQRVGVREHLPLGLLPFPSPLSSLSPLYPLSPVPRSGQPLGQVRPGPPYINYIFNFPPRQMI